MSKEFFEKMNKRLAQQKLTDIQNEENKSFLTDKSIEDNLTQETNSNSKTDNECNHDTLSTKDNNEIISTVEDNLTSETVIDETITNETTVVNIKNIKLDDTSEAQTTLLDSQAITPKNQKPVVTYEEKINQILASIEQLFLPFKTVLIQNIPFTKKPLFFIYKFAWLVGVLTKFIALRFPLIKYLLSSWTVKIIITLMILLFLSTSILSRYINTADNITTIENAVSYATGYKTKINGLVKISLFPNISIALHNVIFDLNNSNFIKPKPSNNGLQVSILESDYMILEFAWLPMFVGHFNIKSVILNRAHLDLNINNNDNSATNVKNYQRIIQQVENKLNGIAEISSQDSQILTDSKLESHALATQAEQLTDNVFSKSFVDDNEEIKAKTQKNSPATEAKIVEDIAEMELEPTKNNYNKINNQIKDTSFMAKLVFLILDKGNFHFRDLEFLNLKRSRINLLDSDNHNWLTFRNVNTFIESYDNILSLEGSYNFMNNNFSYDSQLTFAESKIEFMINSSVEAHSEQIITLKGYQDYNHNIVGTITSKKGAILLWLNQFIVDLDMNTKTAEFKSNFLLSNNLLHLNNLELKINDIAYSGNILLSLSNTRFAEVNLQVKIADITPYMSKYLKNINQLKIDNENGSSFLTIVNKLEKWKNQKLSLLDLDYIYLNLQLNNAKLFESSLDAFNSSVLINLIDNTTYLNSIKFNNNKTIVDMYGKVNLDNKSAVLNSNFEGSLNDSLSILHTPTKMQVLIASIAKQNDNYNLNSRISLVKNRILISNIKGNLGDIELKDTFAILMERSDNLDIVINTHVEDLNFDYLTDIYNQQIAHINDENKNSQIQILDLSDKISLKIKVQADKLNYKSLNFKQAYFNVNFFDSGFFIDRMLMQGQYGGSAIIVFNSDVNVKPMIVGHMFFNNLIVHFSELQKFIFSQQKLIGNVVLNGKLKFNSDDLANPIDHLSGNITLVKKERIDLNRFANTDSLYMTITDKGKKGNKQIFINDIYGTVKVKNNIVDLYPISFLYILNNQKYRGVLQVLADLQTAKIQINGQADNSLNINKGIKFNIKGDFLKPKISRIYTKKKLSNVAKAVPKSIDIMEESKKYATVANGILDKDSDTYFYKQYNKRSSKYTKGLTQQLYQKNMDKIDQIKNEDLRFPEESNK